ncbi:arginase, partial [Xanthomonas oryzae pv. oryzae]
MARPMPCCAAARHGAGVPLECSVLSILEQCMATQYVPVSLIGV